MALQEELEIQGNFLFKYRGTLPLFLLSISILSFIYIELNQANSLFNINYNYIEIIALFISFLGLLIRILTIGYAYKNTSGRNTKKGQIADKLNTTGIYSTVRHPLYVGNFFMWLGPAILVQNFWFIIAFIFAYWIYYERIMFAEEQFLRKKFGEIYTSWAKKTPAFIMSFKNYIKPKEKFSWKKIIKQEKNGFTAIFIVFYTFNAIKLYIHGYNSYMDIWLFYPTIGSIILYYIIKITKRHTLLFEDGK